MDKVIALLKNKWFKFGVSFLSLGFPVFIINVDWLSFAYYLEPKNPVPLFLLYVLVNFIFGGIMFYTRRQIVTQIVACVTPLAAFVMLILAFGQWYMIIPPVAICFLTFLAAGTNETFKTILGTIYLLMFVVGTLAYLTLLHFNLTVDSLLPITMCDVTKRSDKYIYSPEKTYRVVRYLDNSGNERTVASYYIEKTEEDVELPYLSCYKHLYSLKVLVSMDADSVQCRWTSDTELYVDGRIKDIPDLFEKAELEREKEEEDSGDILTYYELNGFVKDEEDEDSDEEKKPVTAENDEDADDQADTAEDGGTEDDAADSGENNAEE